MDSGNTFSLNDVIEAGGSASGILDDSSQHDSNEMPAVTTENNGNATPRVGLSGHVHHVHSTPATKRNLRRRSIRIEAKGRRLMLQGNQSEVECQAKAKVNKPAKKISSKPRTSVKRGNAMSELPDCSKERNCNARNFFSRTVQNLKRYDSLYGDHVDIKFEAVFRPYKTREENFNKTDRYTFKPNFQKSLAYDDIKKAVSEVLDSRTSNLVGPTSSVSVAVTPTNISTAPFIFGTPVQIPAVGGSMCMQNACSFKALKNNGWITCKWTNNELEVCNYRVHTACLGYPLLTDQDIANLPAFFCPTHVQEKVHFRV